MARISGVDLPRNKRVEIALTYIYGIGLSTSQKVLAQANVNPDTRVRDPTDEQVNRLRDIIDRRYTVEGDLRRETAMNIKRLTEIGSYRGLRHRRNLPVRGQEAVTDDYRDLLGLISHEYFHLWNIKRMKPAVFRPYDLASEWHTGLLWVCEGITSYYDDLALVRSGLITVESYLELVGQAITRVQRGAGRRRHGDETEHGHQCGHQHGAHAIAPAFEHRLVDGSAGAVPAAGDEVGAAPRVSQFARRPPVQRRHLLAREQQRRLADLPRFLDCFVGAGDIGEGDLGLILVDRLGLRLAELHDAIPRALHLHEDENHEPGERRFPERAGENRLD